MENLPKLKIIIGLFILVAVILLSGRIAEENDAGGIVVIQYPITGDLKISKDAGWVWQGLGKATHYRKSNQFWFLSAKDQKGVENASDNSLPVTWNDGGVSKVSGSTRWDMPLDDKAIIEVHSKFGSQESIETSLIKTNMEKSIFLTGPLMSSKESYAERRSDLISLIEDQANKGVYRTKTVEIDTQDPLTGQIKKEKTVQVREVNGVVQRQEVSSIAAYGLKLYNVAIKDIEYDGTVRKQIQGQQAAIMSVQSAIANAKRAEQDAITAAKQGEANAAKAKWEIEVTKAKMVTQAEAKRAVAEQDVLTAELNKRRDILEGEGIAAKKRLVMQADGALNEKLKAYVETQKFWADAFAKYQGSFVPQFIGTGGGGNNANALQFMEIMGAKAARDLALDLSNKK